MNHVRKRQFFRTPRTRWRGEWLLLCAFLTVFPFILVGCGASPPRTSGANHPPDVIRSEGDSSQNILTIDPLLPPDGDVRPPRAGETGRPRNEQGLPILEAKGLNVEKMFSEDIKDPVERIKRLENTVLEMRRDFDSVIPAINRLLAIEADIQELTTQLQALLNEEGKGADQSGDHLPLDSIAPLDALEISPPPASDPTGDVIKQLKSNAPKSIDPLNPDILGESVPEVSIKPKKLTSVVIPPARPKELSKGEIKLPSSETPGAPLADQTLGLSSIRLGHHQDKLRLVIDVPREIAFTADLDHQKHLLVIELPGVVVDPARQDVPSSALVKNMALETVKGQKNNSRAVFELKSNTKILMSTLMPPSGDKTSWGLVMDLDSPKEKGQ